MKSKYRKCIAGIFGISVLVGCGPGLQDFSKQLTGKYYYHRINSVDRFIAPPTWKVDHETIPRKVIEYKYNREYIVACRESVVDESEPPQGSRLFDYWIIDVQTDTVYGPLRWEEFIDKGKQLGIGKSLVLKKR